MRNPVVILVSALIAIAAISFVLVTGESGRASPPTGGMEAMSVDMDPSAAPANTGTSIGSAETCAQINENDILDADEDAIDIIELDVTALNIPAADPAIGTTFTLLFPAPNVTVSEVATPYASDNGWNILSISDPPQTDGDYVHNVVDAFSTGTSGTGTISRLNLETMPGVFSGVMPLQLSFAAHIDTTNTPQAPDDVNNALVAIGTSCTMTTPPPGTPTPTPTAPVLGTVPPPSQTDTPTPPPPPTPTATPTATPTPSPTPTATPTLPPGETEAPTLPPGETEAPTLPPGETEAPTLAPGETETPTPTATPAVLPDSGGSPGGSNTTIVLLLAGAGLLAVSIALGGQSAIRKPRRET